MTGKFDYGTQLGAIRAHRQAARHYLIDILEDPDRFSRLASVQEQRLQQGNDIYGDSEMWQYTDHRLIDEAEQELADGLNYLSVLLARYSEEGNG